MKLYRKRFCRVRLFCGTITEYSPARFAVLNAKERYESNAVDGGKQFALAACISAFRETFTKHEDTENAKITSRKTIELNSLRFEIKKRYVQNMLRKIINKNPIYPNNF